MGEGTRGVPQHSASVDELQADIHWVAAAEQLGRGDNLGRLATTTAITIEWAVCWLAYLSRCSVPCHSSHPVHPGSQCTVPV